MYQPQTHVRPLNDANRLGLDYRTEAHRLGNAGPIWDCHSHINSVASARVFFEVCDWFGVQKVWSMTPLESVDAIRAEFPDRIEFIAVPNYARRFEPETFALQWLRDIEGFAERGYRMCKFWAAPRGRDLSPHLQLDSPVRIEGMKLARSLGMMFMTHVADPDTWFASHYRDHRKYGTKAEQYVPLMRLLDEFNDVPWIGAHMGGNPEDLDFLQMLLDRYPNYYIDTSATKWMVRELSKHPHEFRDFCRRNPGRVLFGSDLVTNDANIDYDNYASRYWALRVLFETDYVGPSPIVDPDLSLLDPTLPKTATAAMSGAAFDPATLHMVYHGAPQRLLGHRLAPPDAHEVKSDIPKERACPTTQATASS
jgi:hypothetical protein